MALIDTILQKGHSSYQKDRLTKMAPNINGISQKCISQKWHVTKMATQNLHYWSSEVLLTTLLIETTPTIRHKLEKLDFKIP